MFSRGSVVVKIAGRESGRYAIVVEKIDEKFVIIDGDVKRRKCNVRHLEPTGKIIKIDKNASKGDIIKEFIANKLKIKKREIKRKVKKENGKEKGNRKKVQRVSASK